MNQRLYFIIVIGIFTDQLTKWLAQHYLFFFKPIVLIKGAFSLQLVHNYGAAYGILQHYRFLLLSISVLVLVCLFIFRNQLISSRLSQYGFMFLVIGTSGNFIDRLFRGFVVDFIDINVFPVFNLADVCIDIGLVLLAIDLIFYNERNKRNA